MRRGLEDTGRETGGQWTLSIVEGAKERKSHDLWSTQIYSFGHWPVFTFKSVHLFGLQFYPVSNGVGKAR